MKRDQQKICREEWFKDHRAAVLLRDFQSGKPEPTTVIIEWKKPTSWNYGCRFIIHSQWLTVVGDLGEAVYQWSEQLTCSFLFGLNFDYFHGKCRASPTGSRFESFDARNIEAFKQGMTTDELEFVNEEISSGMSKSDVDQAISAAISGDRIGFDFAQSLMHWGTIPDVMCVGHYVGLQMALKQLMEPPVAAGEYGGEKQ